jgi:hypothetical protein
MVLSVPAMSPRARVEHHARELDEMAMRDLYETGSVRRQV